MNEIELRAECIRQASANLREMATNTDMVIEEAKKLYDFIVNNSPESLDRAAA